MPRPPRHDLRIEKPGDHLVARWATELGHGGGRGGNIAKPAQGSSQYRFTPVARIRYQPFFAGVGAHRYTGSAYPLFRSLENIAEWAALNPETPVQNVYDWAKRRFVDWPSIVLELLPPIEELA